MLLSLLHITNTLLKAYLQQLFYLIHYIWLARKNYEVHKNAKKTQFEKTKQESEPDMADMLEWSDWEFSTAMINMFRALMDKVDSMQEHMGRVNRDGKPKKKEKEMLKW